MNNQNKIYIFIGTTAEFIKLMPVMNSLSKNKVSYEVISSGQNDIVDSHIWNLVSHNKTPNHILNPSFIKQTPLGLLKWFIKTFFIGIKRFKKLKSLEHKNWVFVHGDTISTLLGALLAKIYGFKVCHIEAGLRSFNYLKPFPEEICRVFVSRLADIAVCPNDWALNNLNKRKYPKINTLANTLFDAVLTAKTANSNSEFGQKLPSKFFLLVMHRQENLLDKDFFNRMIELVLKEADQRNCVFILHSPTKKVLEGSVLYQKLLNHKNILLLPRQEFPEFIKLIDKAEFLLTDGGSNQEESYYLGKPCLVLRKETERIEGLNHNVLLSEKNFVVIQKFLENPELYQKEPVRIDVAPSDTAIKEFLEISKAL